MAPASVTKIMTAYLVFEAIKGGKLALDRQIMVSELAEASRQAGSGCRSAPSSGGDRPAGQIVKSANDVR